MKASVKDYFSTEFIKFVTVSTFAAGVNFFARIVINMFTSYVIAIILAYIIGMITAFLLNKLLIFKKGKKQEIKQFAVFVLVNIFAILQTLIVSLLLRNTVFVWIGFEFYSAEIAHLIGLGIPVFTSYLGHKYFSFA